ncbi:MAG: multiheme c-type cytochrome, partial [Bacteroidia bacterium]
MANRVRLGIHITNKAFVLFGLLAVISILFFYSSCTSSSVDEVSYLNHADDVGYVGIEKCAECHSAQHSTFIHTGMGLSFADATMKKSSAEFNKSSLVYDSLSNLYYYPYWKDSIFYIREFRLQGNDTVHHLEVEVDYIVGSGQHTNSHLVSTNGYVYQAPITYYVQKGRWDLAPGFENGNNSRFSRILDSECISCHNSMPKMEKSSNRKFATLGQGIDCERCHGPGQLHVQQRENGGKLSEGEDRTIVNPKKLSWERQIDLCQRCHLQGLNILKDGKKFTDFKPGMKLSEVFEIYLPKFSGKSDRFDMANHSERFQMSQCFIQGNNESLDFTCISCHNPHISVQMTQIDVFNSTCAKCHTNRSDCTEGELDRSEVDDNCVSCHMPKSGSVDIPHVSVHDHYIRVPNKVNEMKPKGDLTGLYAVNNAKPEEHYQIKAYLEYWEKFDKNPFFINEAEKMLEGSNEIGLLLKFHYLKEQYEEVLNLKVDESQLGGWELYMLGVSYARLDK